ncbi:MAG: lysine 2,3-aminomutase [Moorea sp. SIO4E2]|uniref:KamA family radical SAM protein n=1 Tax=Moorena sp. SIO4E2 TaxID=2607826 RepID=UPI0013B67B08|nr:lysine 2,3-aminomutase [Moorena sp. SIO4E2]NEQ09789.1 lysine 2,3-aminomutase [Moorena sp. SIO4E2]
MHPLTSNPFNNIGSHDIENLPQLQKLPSHERLAMKAVSKVFPFRVNNYIVEQLIDWNNLPDDPIFRMTFPHPDMLNPEDLNRVIKLLKTNGSKETIRRTVDDIRSRLNPHPGGQVDYNVPRWDGELISGIQHKYPDTVLIFPSSGQACHAYCQFCFRWAQFVDTNTHKFTTRESGRFQDYLRQHKEVTDVVLTGGDPMIMSARRLFQYIEPLLDPEFEHIQTIRIGTKSVAYWPYRYVTDRDADDVLRLFEKIVYSGKHLAVMGHYTHWRELDTPIAQEAIRRIRSTGAQLRAQSPLLKHVNDSARAWRKMWQMQVRLGCIPYYMFVERDTGPKHYFGIPLVRTWEIFRHAIKGVSGLSQTVRGPVMSALPGKVLISGVAHIMGERVFVLSFIRGRDPNWCKVPFFAHYDPEATWFGELAPAFGEKEFFYEKELEKITRARLQIQ